ncbi:glyoxalase [Legionella quinlivanii]|uniref:Glyoxalase n=1 Tax=Legionella quinlivanii TaxID=45073 RepID=A0A364LGQ2_9GAMM|nr:VOC family protein [Legionella quinlivanii]RAP35411.1 glyoxalase [Legionella quinlivanii]
MDKPQVGNFCWNELATPDVSAAKEFYGKLLGWQFTEQVTGDMVYNFIKIPGSDDLGGIWGIPKDRQNEIPPHWMGYILVEDLEDKLEKATELGATVKMPVTPVGEIGYFAILVDPTGAHIALWQNK